MVKIKSKVRSIENLFRSLQKDIEKFKQRSGLKCIPGCCQCCLNPNIETTILEFLPLAYYFYQAGQFQTWLHKIEEKQQKDEKVCILLLPQTNGHRNDYCSEYERRPLICRFFGFSAIQDKYGQKMLYTCQEMKKHFPESYNQAVQEIKKGSAIPVMKNYYFRLYSIDLFLAQEFYPINTAIKLALEMVASHFSYHRSQAKPVIPPQTF